jgi:hypothetical protein
MIADQGTKIRKKAIESENSEPRYDRLLTNIRIDHIQSPKRLF